MSVMALIVKPDAYALIAADGAATDPRTGALAGTMSKILTFPDISAVMGITGIGGFTNLMQWFMPPHVSSFDELVEILPDLVLTTAEFVQKNGKFGMFQSCIVLAGWSEKRQKFEGWRVMTYDKESITLDGETRTLEAFEIYPMVEDRMWSSAGPSAEVMKRFGIIDGPESDSDLDVVTRMICAARQDSGKVTTEDCNYNAGCFVEVAMMQRGYCHSWIAHRWPEDVTGEPIDPTRGQPLPDHLMAHYDAQA